MRNKKVLCLVLVVVAVLGFTVGGIAEANTDLMTKLITDANVQLGKTGYDKKNELIQNVGGAVEAKVAEVADPLVDERAAEIEALLEQYFNAKLNDVNVDTTELEAQLEFMVNEIFTRYKKEIDTAFSGLL